MVLFLMAQDLGTVEIGLAEYNGKLLACKTFQSAPEKMLFLTQEVLAHIGKTTADLDGVVVITGPGSFTSTRLAVTMMNGLSFVRNLPILGWENSERRPLRDLMESPSWPEDLGKAPPGTFVQPVYDRPAHITLRRNRPLI
ncbi:MAG TPA: hypothetical protein VJB99_01795 [Patescibacteria group bacterium]|nr:hypothetical protein [Patescibacteria group bacterium]